MRAIVLAAGKGTRMNSRHPKVLHEILGRPVLDYVLGTLPGIGIKKPVLVVGAGAHEVRAHIGARASFVLQKEQRGTGHAVMVTSGLLGNYRGDVLIWPGDMPLVTLETLRKFIGEHRKVRADASVLSALRPEPTGYGRILRAGGSFTGIREELDASKSEKRIQEVNTGIYLFDSRKLFPALAKIKPENKKGEYYLTDTIEILSREDARLEAFPFAGPEEGQGINSREDLAMAAESLSRRQIRTLQSKGVTFVAPQQTFVAPDVKIGQDTVVYPWCFIEEKVTIGKNCRIGPFAKIRSGSVIGDGSVIGSFVEVNRSRIGKKVFAKHLAYLGDAFVGDGTNIGAGTITANFDGKVKQKTYIGRKVLVGSDTVFVAPVRVGASARTGAGAVLTAGTKVRAGETVAGVPARILQAKAGKSTGKANRKARIFKNRSHAYVRKAG